MRNIILLFFLAFTQISVAQSQSETQRYYSNLSSKITTLKINVTGNPTNQLILLRNEYVSWKGKIISITIDSTNHELAIEHNALWQMREIYEMTDKYKIPRHKIISDK
ncbi:MAG: hypothetical protein K0R26_1226 [Bacteroidota bacterium]|jgi:hypothetical protein|nr:hypothetical protein [Bacteroidota bacterium]